MIHDDNYESEVLLTNNLYFLACTRYPITIFENDKVWICLEGMIYNKESSQTNRELNHLLTGIYENWPLTIKLLVGYWMRMGDFIIYAINKQADSFIVLNDVLSRLPREMHFILNLMPVIDVKFFHRSNKYTKVY